MLCVSRRQGIDRRPALMFAAAMTDQPRPDPRPQPRLADPNAAAHERVFRSLRQQVMHGELAPGQPMTLRGIAAQFGVSMTPVREAARRLAAEGALTISSSGRITTPDLSPERIEELAAIRALMEPEMAARALPRVHFALIERLSAINALNAEAVLREDAVAYVTHYPCINCAKILAAAGIGEIRYREDYHNDAIVGPLLADAGVKITKL